MARPGSSGTNAAIRNIMEWSRRPEWLPRLEEVIADHIGDLAEQYGLGSNDELFETLGAGCSNMLFGAAFEDFLTRPYSEYAEGDGEEGDGETIVDEYLRRRGFKESVPGRRYLEGLRDSSISLYEVLESVPDSHLVLRDLIRGGEVRAEERSGSRQIVKWDRIACRVVPLNQKIVLSGAPLPLDPEEADELLTQFNALVDETSQRAGEDKELAELADLSSADQRKLIAAIVLVASAPLFTQRWLGGVLEKRFAPPPELRNTDGEDIVFVTTAWPVAGNAEEIVRRLDAAKDRDIVRTGEEPDTWNWQSKHPLSAQPGGSGMVLGSTLVDGDGTTLGTIVLDRGELALETNSEPRAERGRELVGTLLAGLLGVPQITRKTLDEIRADAARNPSPPEPLAISAEDQARLNREFKTRYYKTWVDAPVPALDNLTPRQAAQTAEGRPKVVALLKGLESSEEREARSTGIAPLDYGWLWQELGLAPG